MAEMNLSEAQNRIEQLRNTLLEANRQYYVENMPSMSDYDYDQLMYELISLEKEFPELMTEDSPSREVGSDLSVQPDNTETRGFAQYPHKHPMLSLGNTYSLDEIREFSDRVTKSIRTAFTYSCELKFDGTAICLTYKNGELERALTRGDGTVGDDVTENVLHISNIPKRLCGIGWPEEFEIRGEIYMPYAAFDRLNSERIDNEEKTFANPRNAASGSLKLQDPLEVEKRGLECTLYHLICDQMPFMTHDQALKAAMTWGLPVSDKRRICNNIIEIQEYINYWDEARKYLPYATDGIVIKVNELPLQANLGYTSKVPRWAVAYKFKAQQALTKVTSIDFQVGRTGAVTPVANLEPVQLSGTVIKRATLHNNTQIETLDIRVGDYVYVEKGGEIIPKITAVELSKRDSASEAPVFPIVCPDCGHTLVKDEDEAKWFCPNTDSCPTQIKGKLVHFMSRKAMNVLAGEATVDQLYQRGLVRNYADLYYLTRDSLLEMEGWKAKSADRFMDSLNQSKNVSFDHVLFALGIRYVGEQTAKSLALHFGNIDALMNAGREQILKVGDVGEIIADSIVRYFADERHRYLVERLKMAGLKMEMEKTAYQKLSDTLEGMTLLVTGTMSIPRIEMQDLIRSHGGKVASSVSKKTSLVIAGNEPGGEKIKKAETLGIKIITEEEFYVILNEGKVRPLAVEPEKHIEIAKEAETGVQLSLFDGLE